ncbi:hypothetical protein BDZ94DRAFT_1314149 [Collybia nuda]|uniref:Uncharacterized protein n=1 Tax=Collybia nuda TaxID=64659 RepID=A0A9P5XVU8_9AGAR|nr:hypothetical protein BDZ94DRAFT_1314149 [Collybia nuda]
MSTWDAVNENLDPAVLQTVTSQGRSVNATTVIVVTLPAVLIFVFLWFYLTPILRNKKTISAAHLRATDPEVSGIPAMEQRNPNHLVTWMRRGSRGRFIDTQGSHGHRPRPRTNHGRFSFFARSSIIPSLSQVSTPPPPYAARPSTPSPATPAPDYQFPPTVPSPLAPPRENSGAPVSIVRYLGQRRSMSSRPTTGPISPSPLGRISTSGVVLCPPMATRSVSESTLHPSMARLPVPSRALVYDRESLGSPGPTTIVRLRSSPGVSASSVMDMGNQGREVPSS